MKQPQKTNVARLLDKAKVAYELIAYAFDENDLAAQHVAEELGQDIRQVFKTIVLQGDRNGHLVCVVPGNCEVDLKKAARVSGNKKVEPLPIRGGCSPIGMKKHFPTFFHATALDFEHIYVSAGQRGLQIKIHPADLIRESRGEVADVVKEECE